jgi:cobalt-zinc-cadmium efflux system membrane fusion protein
MNTVSLTAAQIQSAEVRLGKVEDRQISGVVKANGQLDVPPQQMVSISAPLGGFLKATELLPGSKVTKGQLIAVIENADYIQLQQDYLEARNQTEFNKADYDRQQELAKENVNAQKTLQQSKANYLNGLARMNGLAARLKLINIDPSSLQEGNITSTARVYSPINGFVTDVNVNIGKFVNPADVLFTIVDTEHLHAELTIFEKDIHKIKIGQKVRFTLANETSERTATVYLIGREIRPDRTITIHCHIDKEDRNLLPGTYLQAVAETGGVVVTALPETAVIGYQGGKFIFTPVMARSEQAKNEEIRAPETLFRMVEIEVGPTESGYTEVILPDNFDRSSDIVVQGGYAILSKMKNSEEDH